MAGVDQRGHDLLELSRVADLQGEVVQARRAGEQIKRVLAGRPAEAYVGAVGTRAAHGQAHDVGVEVGAARSVGDP